MKQTGEQEDSVIQGLINYELGIANEKKIHNIGWGFVDGLLFAAF